MKRGQYSLEFLLTYACAFLIIGIAVAAIYSFGWIRIDEILPEKCEFYGQIYCQDFQASSEGLSPGDENIIQVVLVNRFGHDLVISDMNIYDSINDHICGPDPYVREQLVFFNPKLEFGQDSINTPYIWWNASQALNVTFYNCQFWDDLSSAGSGDVQKWVPGTRFEATMNVSFFNPNTADPRQGEDPVIHSQLGTLYVYIKEI